jgi:hypothetical protein
MASLSKKKTLSFLVLSFTISQKPSLFSNNKTKIPHFFLPTIYPPYVSNSLTMPKKHTKRMY